VKYIYPLIFFVCWLVLSNDINAQTIDSDSKQLDEVLIYRQKDVLKVLNKVISNINKNYPKYNNYNYSISQFSKKDNDTIINFDGDLKIQINYKKGNLYLNSTYGTLCNFKKRYIDKEYYINMFPSSVGKKYKNRIRGGASNEIPFYITGALNMIALLNNDFLTSLSNYSYSINKVNDEIIKLSFIPNEKAKPNHIFNGYILIDKNDYAILEINYKNDASYLSRISDWNNDVSYIDVFLNFKKEKVTDEYVLDNFKAECTFKDEIDGHISEANYYSKTIFKVNENLTEKCMDEKINLTDLGLIFKSKTIDYLFQEKLFDKK
jgi:hypothetical protein